MALSQRFEVVGEIHRSALASVRRAKRQGTDARYALKAFAPQVITAQAAKQSEAAFLERAQTQQKLSTGGARHWAPIYEVGPGGNAYYVTDYFPLTAQKLITGRIVLPAMRLFLMIDAVVRGLREAESIAGRPHGALTPANVLIAGQGESTRRIVLCDPAQTDKIARRDEGTDDLVALGNLIHQFVLHRAFRGAANWPVQPSDEWARLGRRGEKWRDLCNRLLDPSPQQRPADLQTVARLVGRLRPRGRRMGRHVALVMAVLGACAGVAGVIIYRSDHAARAEIADATHDWVGELIRATADDPPRALRYTNADPDLAVVIDQIHRIWPPGTPLQAPAPMKFERQSFQDWRQSAAAAQALRLIRERLSPDQWPLAKRLSERAATFQTRGWLQPGKQLADEAAALRAPTAAALDRVVELLPHLAPGAELEKRWLGFEKNLAALSNSGDDSLASFAVAMRRSAGAGIRLSPDGFSGLEGLAASEAPVAGWATLLTAGWRDRYDGAEFTKDLKKAINPVQARPADLVEWSTRLLNYQLVSLNAAAAPLKPITDAFDRARHDAAEAPLTAAEKASLENEAKALKDRIDAIARLRVSRRALADPAGEVAAGLTALDHDVRAFNDTWSKGQDPQQWFKSVDLPIPGASEPINVAWQHWLQYVRGRLPALGQRAALEVIKQSTARVRTLITDLDRQFPAPPAELAESFRTAAAARREADVMRVLAGLRFDSDAPGLLLPQSRPGVEDYSAWLKNLTDLAQDFPLRARLIQPGIRPDETWAHKEPDFWNDPAIQELVRRDVSRLETLARVTELKDRTELAAVALGIEEEAETVLAAWRRLGSADLHPVWPAVAAELSKELQIEDRLKELLAPLPDDQRKSLEAEITTGAVTRWGAFVNQNASDPAFAAAGELGPKVATVASAGGSPKGPAGLTAQSDFNLQLYAARKLAKQKNTPDLKPLAAALAALPKESLSQVADLQRNLTGARRPPWAPAADKMTYAANNSRAMMKVPGLDQPIEFVRLDSDETGSFYLATTEMSLGQFVAALIAGGIKQPANVLPNPANLRGPRVWRFDGDQLTRSVYWLSDKNWVGFESGLRAGGAKGFNPFSLDKSVGGNPSMDHPMQQLGPIAALQAAAALNCRLPSSKEWAVAFSKAASEKDASPWNLRDGTWEIQKKFIQANGGAGPWPDDGIFLPGGATGPAAHAAANYRDGTLFFSIVGAGAGHTFSNLVGNVAEMVFDDPESFEALPRKDAESLAPFLQQHQKGLFVIGGSALSPPDQPTDKLLSIPFNAPGFSDVGLRLAFTPPVTDAVKAIRDALLKQPYLVSPQPASVEPSEPK